MSPLGMNRIRAPGLTAFRELLPSGLVSFLPTSCWLEAQAPPSCLQPPGPGFWDSLGESKALILLYLPGVKNVLKSVPHRSWRAECFQHSGMGGKMGHEVPTCAGPSQCRGLCVFPGQSAPHANFPGSPDPGSAGVRPSLHFSAAPSPTERISVPTTHCLSVCCSFPGRVQRLEHS